MVPVSFKNKSFSDDTQLSLFGLTSIVFMDSHKVSLPGLQTVCSRVFLY